MKILACTAAVCVVIALSIFTTQKTIETEGRRTRASMPGVLSSPLGDGESLVSKVEKLNATLSSINKRLTRLEDTGNRETKVKTDELKAISTDINQEVERIAARLNAISKEQDALRDIPAQLQVIDRNMRIAILAKENEAKAAPASDPPKEIIETLDWMVQKIDAIDSYFTPLYSFLGAVYTEKSSDAATSYPSVDKRLNEMIMQLDQLQKDMKITLKNVSPHVREPSRYPRPFEEREQEK